MHTRRPPLGRIRGGLGAALLVAALLTIPLGVAAMAEQEGAVPVGRADLAVTQTAPTSVTPSPSQAPPTMGLTTTPSSTSTSSTITATSSTTTTTPTVVSAPGVDRRVLAFLYPWFGPGATSDPQLSVHPMAPYIAYKPASAQEAARLARTHGIDGFVLSFAGASRQGLALRQVLDAAAATGGTATVVIESREARTAAVIERWIAEALSQADQPAFLRVDGVPVVFAFASGTIPATAWGEISDHLAAAGHPVKIVGDVTPSATNRMAGQYRYNTLMRDATSAWPMSAIADWNRALTLGLRTTALRRGQAPGLVVATVQPGWDDRPLRGQTNLAVDRAGTTVFEQTWRAAIAADPDMVLITSWNEWYEGTGIAPSREYGTTALDATATWAAAFKSG